MENYLLLVSFLGVLYCFKSIFRKSLLTIFCLIWFSVFALYSLRLYGVYDSSQLTYLVYLCGFLSFFLGYFIVRPKSNRQESKYIKDKFAILKHYIVLLLCVVSVVVFLLKSIVAIPYWLSGGAANLKHEIIMDDALSIGMFGDILFTFVGRPFQIIITIFAVVVIFKRLKYNSIIWMAVILNLTMYTCTASKVGISVIVITAIAYIFLFSELTLKDALKKYKLLFFTLAIVVFFVLLLTVMKDDDAETGSSLYVYLCGCIPCSDQALEQMSDYTRFYGIVSFNGLLRAVNVLPNYFGISPPAFKLVLDVATEYMQEFEETIYIGDNIPYNAFISMFSYFYADGGLYGVVIISFLFGFLCSWFFNKSQTAPSIYSQSFVLLLVLFIMTSMVRFQVFIAYYAMALVYIIVLFPRTVLKDK